MGIKTKIDWCDASWNPVTGCLHECEYCYARGIATRFAGFCPEENPDDWAFRRGGTLVELEGPQARIQKNGKVVPAPYPFGFTPTLHKYKLDEPKFWKKPRTIFVCSMADLFGDWVPDDWIKAVFEACKAAPQHRYMFLTKNPIRYLELADKGALPKLNNYWYGTSTPDDQVEYYYSDQHNIFVSVEPILGDFNSNKAQRFNWAIIGAETGNRKGKVIPDRSWIEHVAGICKNQGIPVFMKSSIKDLMGADFRQEFPWG